MSPLPILNFSESRQLDAETIQGSFLSGFELMRRAGEAMASEIAKLCRDKHFSKNILLLAGKGNNAGDAFVAARALLELGFYPKVVLAHPKEDLRSDALLHFKTMESAQIPFALAGTGEEFRKSLETFSGDLVVDALLGTGFRPPLQGHYTDLIQALNERDFYVVSLDLPSGMNEGSSSLCVRADLTLTVGSFKKAFLQQENWNLCGRVLPLDIGFPKDLWKSLNPDTRVFVKEDLKTILRRRPRHAHKGHFGRILLAGGAYGFSGALILAGLGALKSGSGLLTLASSASVRDLLHSTLTEAMSLDSSKLNSKTLEKFDAVGIGPGLGTSAWALKTLKILLKTGKHPLVLDADALNLLSANKVTFKKSKRITVLTPHPGEAARLLKMSVHELEADRFQAARNLQTKWGGWIVLKGAHTVVCGPEGIFLHLTGTPAMSTGGMGDVLTGMITSFLAQGYSPWEACNVSVALQGLAAETLESLNGPFGLLASEVANQIPPVVNSLGRLR